MRSSWLCFLTLALFLGCASEQGNAQESPDKSPPSEERKAPKGKPAKKGGKSTAKSKKKKMDPLVYQATIRDRFMKAKDKAKPFTITRVRLFVPEVSLFGGSAGKESKTLVLKRGSASIEVPFAKLLGVEILGKAKEDDRLMVKLEVQSKKPEGRFLSGSVKISLELRGVYAGNEFKTTVKLREVKTLTLALDPSAKENKGKLPPKKEK
jgi:hypothetical protein